MKTNHQPVVVSLLAIVAIIGAGFMIFGPEFASVQMASVFGLDRGVTSRAVAPTATTTKDSARSGTVVASPANTISLLPCSTMDTTPTVQVASPNGGEFYQPGQQITVRWRTCNIPSASTMVIGFLYPAIGNSTIGITTPNDGSETITVPNQGSWPQMIYGNNFKISVFLLNSATAGDMSDNLFSIVQAPTISVSPSVNNPAARIVQVSNTATTNGVELLRFKVTATGSDVTLKKIPIQIHSSGPDVSTMINTLRLYNGPDQVDNIGGQGSFVITGGVITSTMDGTTPHAGFVFSNLSTPFNMVFAGTSSEFSIVADMKSVIGGGYPNGATLTASFLNGDVLSAGNFSVLDSNSNQIPGGSTNRSGSSAGNTMTFMTEGVRVTAGTPTYSSHTRGGTSGGANDIVGVEYHIPVTMTAFGQTRYVGTAASYGSATGAVSFGFNDAIDPFFVINSGSPAPGVSVPSSVWSSVDAPADGAGYRLDVGVARHFDLTIYLDSSQTTPGVGTTHNLRAVLTRVHTWSDPGLSGGSFIQGLSPLQLYTTGYQTIHTN